MKITTKLSAGFGVLLVLILVALSYQLTLFHSMVSINRDLSGINFRAAIISLQLLRDLEQVEEFTRKYFVTQGDPGYAARLREMRDTCARGLAELKTLRLSAKEREEIDRLSGFWSQFSETATRQEEAFASRTPRRGEAGLSAQLVLLNRLRVQTQAIIRESRLAIASRVGEAAAAGELAEKIAWGAAAAALLLSLLLSFWIIRSIAEPLGELTAGTRAVAEGKLYYQLDSSGRDELAQLARDFNTMTQRLRELDEIKKDFVAHVSHELKTPLASMQETIRLLLDEIPGPLVEQQRRLLELNLQSSRRLSSMIANLLDMSCIEAGVMRYDFQEHDLAALVRVVLEELEVQVGEKGLHLEAHLPPEPVPVKCDGDRIIQVLGNLLGNALKFTPRGEAIRVRLETATELPGDAPEPWRKTAGFSGGGRFALVSVSDSGKGVPDVEKERIFEKFHQSRPAGMRAGQGAGLGLAISRGIVEAHRGAIWVEDNPAGGSVFFLLLVAQSVAQEAAHVSHRP